MAAVSVTSKGQVIIPRQVRLTLGITPGSKVEFDLEGGVARLRVVRSARQARLEDGTAILSHSGPRISVEEMRGRLAMKKASRRAGR
jgi:AbrB family looped-hinge helix DNA binding protein